jgi:hypothetical protein
MLIPSLRPAESLLRCQINCGKLRSHPAGGYEIHLPLGEIVYGPGGRGLTKDEAERTLDWIENRLREVAEVQQAQGV